MSENVLCVDPERPSAITTTNITQTSVTVSWSIGQTQVVNTTMIRYRVTTTGATWQTHDVVDTTSTRHTVPSLQPGTEYEIYVAIHSYGKSAISNTVTITTGNKQPAYRSLFVALTRGHSALHCLCLSVCLSVPVPLQ